MSRRVVFGRRALDDLREVARWIAANAGLRTAARYVARLRVYCERFDEFSERGTRRDDLRPGLRTIGFERRVTVVFAVFETEVVILRLLYGGRDIDAALAEDDGFG